MITAAAFPRTVPVITPIPLAEWLPWALFVGMLLLFLLYIVGFEQGATAIVGGQYVHEWVHDARHLFGFPCH